MSGGGEGEQEVDLKLLVKRKEVMLPRSSIRELLVKEAHEGGLMGHYGELKTYEVFCRKEFEILGGVITTY
ncbi:hypothetical protein CR513_42048, partial [Mucuna pruriens]